MTLSLFLWFRSLSIAGCNLPAGEFCKLTDQIHLNNIRKLDVSGCFWLPIQRILDVLYTMPDLEELAVDNTGIELVHLLEILPRCTKMRKLSLDVFAKKTTGSQMKFCQMFWKEDTASVLLQCFNRLQSLKMTWYNTHEKIFWTFLVRLLQ